MLHSYVVTGPTSPARPLRDPKGVNGDIGICQGRRLGNLQSATAITDFLSGTRRSRRKEGVSWQGITGRLCRKRIAIAINLIRLCAARSRSPARAIRIGGSPGPLDATGAAGHGTRSGQRQRRDVVSASATTWPAADPAGAITVRDLSTRDCTVDAEPITTGRSTSSVPRPELSPHRRSCILLAVAAPLSLLIHATPLCYVPSNGRVRE
jgi:hypothetical protein